MRWMGNMLCKVGDFAPRPYLRPLLRRLWPYAALAVLLLHGAPRADAENFFEWNLTNDFRVYHNTVSGPGAANSALTEGTSYLEVLGFSGRGRADELNYDFYIGGQMTDDPSYDTRRYSLVNFSLNADTPQQAISLGDTFQSFSQYTLTTSLKGGAYTFKGGNSPWMPKVTALYGLAAPRWDSIWGGRDTRTIDRHVYGTRVAFETSPIFSVGFNLVGLNDNKPTQAFDRVYDDSQVYAMDIHYRPIPGLFLFSETAFNDVRVGTGASNDREKLKGYAVKLSAIGDEDPSRVIIEYERIDPEFDNPLGSATADREKFKVGWRYKFNRDVQMHTNMLWFRDNLNYQRAVGRTDYYRPEIAADWRRPFNRRYGAIRLSYSKTIARREGANTKNDDLINLNYRDRFGVIDTDTNLGYSLYRNESGAERKNNEVLYNTVLRSRFSTGMFILRPAIYLGGWNQRDELAANNDRYYQYSVGLGIDVPAARVTSNLRVGRNELIKEVGDDSSKFFGNVAIYWRPAFMDFLDHGMLFVQGFINDFDFTTNSRNFQENSITAGFTIAI